MSEEFEQTDEMRNADASDVLLRQIRYWRKEVERLQDMIKLATREYSLQALVDQSQELDMEYETPVFWIDSSNFKAAMEQKDSIDGALRYLTTKPRDGDIALYLSDQSAKPVNAIEAQHDSDCAIHNEPAYPAGSCDCSRLGVNNIALSQELCKLLSECLELEDNWPGIAYTEDLKNRITEAMISVAMQPITHARQIKDKL